MNILFISRAYPPTIGGLERQNYQIVSHLKKLTNLTLLANKKGKKNLPFFLPYSLFQALYLIQKRKIDLICLGDCLLAPIGFVIKFFYRKKPVVTIAHGLDIIYDNRLYQLLISQSLKRLNKVICVSQKTTQEVKKRGVKKNKVVVIPNGLNPQQFPSNSTRKDLVKELKIDLKNKHLLLSVGHLVKRKGFLWFVQNALPKLGKDFLYIIVGSAGAQSQGNEKKMILQAAKEMKVEKQVILTGKVGEKLLKILYNTADVFVMPNIKVKGDMEGFGLVAIEAASCGLPVVASELEGIQDAIKDGKNGYLVEPGNSQEYVKKIKQLINLDKTEKKEFSQKIRKYTKKNYGWQKIIQQYLVVFKSLKK